jgi:hypothetical protein
MHTRPFLVAAFGILGTISLQCRAASKSANAARPNETAKVWTNVDLDRLKDPAPTLILVEKAGPEWPTFAQGEKVWTNPDLEVLRERDSLSILGPEPAPNPPPTASAEAARAEVTNVTPEVTQEAAPYDRTRDPLWYAEQAEQLRTELALTEAGLRISENRLAEARERITQPGIALDRGNVGITPAEGIAILQRRAREIQNELDELGDLARRNDIAPGVLR